MLREFLEPRIRKAQTPPDLLYVNNFDDPDRPMLLSVPAGQGKKLRSVLSQALADIRKELPVRLDNEKYVKKRSELQDRFQAVRSGLIKQMDKTAGKEGFNLDMDEQGSLTLYPLVEGKRLSEDEYEHLDPTLRQGLKQKGDTLLRAMSGMVRKLNSAEQSFRSDERTLEQEVIGSVLSAVLSPAVERILKNCAGPDGSDRRIWQKQSTLPVRRSFLWKTEDTTLLWDWRTKLPGISGGPSKKFLYLKRRTTYERIYENQQPDPFDTQMQASDLSWIGCFDFRCGRSHSGSGFFGRSVSHSLSGTGKPQLHDKLLLRHRPGADHCRTFIDFKKPFLSEGS